MEENKPEPTNNEPVFENRIDLTELQNASQKIKEKLNSIIIGQEELIDLLLIAILSDGHVLIEGVPGVAKTLTAKLLAHSISVDFSRIQFTPDLMPSDIIGTAVFNPKTVDFEFKKGPLFSNIVLIDEINRSPAKTQAALFEVMEEHQITGDGITYKMSEPFVVIATQNPLEQEGTYRLPEAQLDRFLFKIEVGYPNENAETKLLMNFHQQKNKIDVTAVDKMLSADQILQYREKVNQVHADENILSYIAKIVGATRNNPALFVGASPRASLAILKSAKANAALNGKDFITPEDVKFTAPHVLKHRIILTPEKEMEGVLPHDIITKLIESVEIPR
ncbi:MAG TPA: MoxR family ATPase [Vicingaceae bacterium]|nr:MoxR family ATPase [Vicingaceae bacterium]